MKDFFVLTTPAKRFRFIAWIEAASWLALLIGMCFKYLGGIDSAVRVPGMVHGAAFIAYVLIALATAVALSWNWKVALLALAAGVFPPFASLLFEWWAQREGHLAELSTDPRAAADAGPEVAVEAHVTLDA